MTVESKRYELPTTNAVGLPGETTAPTTGTTTDAADKLDWAATAAASLWTSGWANVDQTRPVASETTDESGATVETSTETAFSSASDVFDYFQEHFENKRSYTYCGETWFLNGDYPNAILKSQNLDLSGAYFPGKNLDKILYWVPAFQVGLLEKLWSPEASDYTTVEESTEETTEETGTESGTTEETPTVDPYYGAASADVVFESSENNASECSLDGRLFTGIKRSASLSVWGYEIGGFHNASFGLKENVRRDYSGFSDPRKFSAFLVSDPDDGNTTTTDAETGEETTTPPTPFWCYAKFYPQYRAFRLVPVETKESWDLSNDKKVWLTAFVLTLKNPDAPVEETTPAEGGTTPAEGGTTT